VLIVLGLIVTVAVLVVMTTTGDFNAKHGKALLQAKYLADAWQAYSNHPDSNGQPPKSLDDLLNPPFGGGSFLRTGEYDLLDPWLKRFRSESRVMDDGSLGVIIFTIADDGTPISQFGIGPLSQVNK
jgi:hypothetical protein